MRFTKPAWVAHRDTAAKSDSLKRLSIFSVHVHPDGSRIATGGLDAKIRIWSTKPILNTAAELSNKPPKALSTLTMHTGPVLTVRWAHSGRWLASGSDDEIVMIWDFDPSAKGKVWGSDEVNVEGWKPLKRLPGHESDVTDVAWSPGDHYLASVGLDSKVIIWDGYTHERIRKLDQHQGFVKGVCWDPAGEYLATQSDDRSVKIWRTSDWSIEAEVTKPFEDSPGSTFFRRLSWSPDGAHITASNATNNKGFVFIASVITRTSWASDISLVGHENTVEVASYNPHMFLRNPQAPVQTSNICSVVALGADDCSVSVWQTKSARPLIVAKEVFERQILDLSWSWDGLTLYAVSSDGTLAAFNFDPDELEGICPRSLQTEYLKKFGNHLPNIPSHYSHTAQTARLTPPPSPKSQPHPLPIQNGFGSATDGGERVNVLVAKRGGKKRVGLTTIPITKPVAPQIPLSQPAPPLSQSLSSISHSNGYAGPSLSGVSISKRAQQVQQQQQDRAPSVFDIDADTWASSDVRIDSLEEGGRKRRATNTIENDESKRPRTLGGDRKRVVVQAKELSIGVGPSMAQTAGSSLSLPIPTPMTKISTTVEGSDELFEVINPESEEGEPFSLESFTELKAIDAPEVSLMSGKHTQWLDYLPSPALAVCAASRFCAVALIDGQVLVYTLNGRRLMPSMDLGSPCSFIDGRGSILMIITSNGQLYSWLVFSALSVSAGDNLGIGMSKNNRRSSLPVSVSSILTSPNYTITSAKVQPTGASILTCSSGVIYSYDLSLCAFVKLTERWWSEGSDVWQARKRSLTNPTANRGVLSVAEGTIAGMADDEDIEETAEKIRPKYWTEAMTLAHLETRMHSARLLDSGAEFKQALSLYTRKLADEGYKSKAEELIRELLGPIYARGDTSWSSTVAGLSKRELLKDVLSTFVRSKTLTQLAVHWQDVLRRANNEE
ncbi:Protein HIR [Mycena indigotica]|uniref:Protein HIR n=1 Tax=Mycena indigotica TaxID=2126181 RepID=A0A8H6VS76_9AGAR|nr:Protein HIR [Mycena indigotica]KAF7291869.1 Protein HIR [Mycena indigotica]